MLYERILKLESIELENIIDIRLNVGSDKDTKFRSLNHLSKGQQCTAILNLLTLSNNDPLLVDQPEDNLDNSFITNNLVENIRKLKLIDNLFLLHITPTYLLATQINSDNGK